MGIFLRYKQEIYGGKYFFGIEQVLVQWFLIFGYLVELFGEFKKIVMFKFNFRLIKLKFLGVYSRFS